MSDRFHFSPAEIRRARKSLGLGRRRFGIALGFAPANAENMVFKLEQARTSSQHRSLTRPRAILLRAYLIGHLPLDFV